MNHFIQLYYINHKDYSYKWHHGKIKHLYSIIPLIYADHRVTRVLIKKILMIISCYLSDFSIDLDKMQPMTFSMYLNHKRALGLIIDDLNILFGHNLNILPYKIDYLMDNITIVINQYEYNNYLKRKELLVDKILYQLPKDIKKYIARFI